MNILAVLLLAVCCSASLPIKDCGSKHGKVTSVEVKGCTEVPCVFKRGTTVDVKIKFTSFEDSKTAKTVLTGIIGGVPLPFPLAKSDACKYSGITCPLKKGQEYTYDLSMPIKESYPALTITAKWELKDDNSEDLFCIENKVTIA
ncbi:NPC intracellular cholesterol transporter 2 [Nymphon striatum]|nr:NPC intracellular cholesterol transporter 2 [Nymphon striatum]